MNTRALAGLAILFCLAAIPAMAETHDFSLARQHVSFVAGTSDNEKHSAFTYGIDYEYRVSPFLGVGSVLEHAGGDIDATTALLVADLHFGERFILQTGPGIEVIDKPGGQQELAVLRLGALYERPVGEHATFSPQIHVDFTEEHNTLVVLFAWGFHY